MILCNITTRTVIVRLFNFKHVVILYDLSCYEQNQPEHYPKITIRHYNMSIDHMITAVNMSLESYD